MFDIGFGELCLVALVALLVFGPDKLPGVARTAGLWVGRARRFVTTVKQDIDRELRLKELQESLMKSEREDLRELIEQTKSSFTLSEKSPKELESKKTISDVPSVDNTNTDFKSKKD